MTSTSSKQKPITLESIQEAMRQVEALMDKSAEIDEKINEGAEMILQWAVSPSRVLVWAGPEIATETTKALMADIERRYPEGYQGRVRVNKFCAPDAIASIDAPSVLDLGPWLPLGRKSRERFKPFDVRTRT